jgi:hypothetical protein
VVQAGRRFPGGAVIGKTISHIEDARYSWLSLAEGHLTRRLFGSMVRRIWALAVPAG